MAGSIIPDAKSLPGVSDLTDVIFGWDDATSGSMLGVVALETRAGHAATGCNGTRTPAAKWICLLDLDRS